MEFNEKLQELRKQKSLTQEELAQKLYVSRTAISKWESGRGYPNIESLKAIAKVFSVTIDDLLSTDEVLTILEEDKKQRENHFKDLIYGLLDLSIVLLFFLPLFKENADGIIKSVSLISLNSIQGYLKITYIIVLVAMIAIGIMILALQNCQVVIWLKSKTKISIILSVISVLLFVMSLQPYASVFAFTLLAIKVIMLIKRI